MAHRVIFSAFDLIGLSLSLAQPARADVTRMHGDTIPVRPDTVHIVQCSLANGDRFSGNFISYELDTLRVQTQYVAQPFVLASAAVRSCSSTDGLVVTRLGKLVPQLPVRAVMAPSWPSMPAVVSLGNGAPPSLLTGSKMGWRRVMTFSYGYSSGNTDLADLSLSAGLARLTTGSRSQVGGYLRRSRSESRRAADQFSVSLRHDRRISRGAPATKTVTAVFSELGYERDRMRKLVRRVAFNSGMSVPLSTHPVSVIVVDFGMGINVEDYSTPKHTVGWGGLLRLSTSHRIFERARGATHISVLPDIRDVGRYRINSDAQISAPISKAISLRLSVINRYDTRPAPSVRRNDVSIQSGLGVEF
jgi:hypothetical protein